MNDEINKINKRPFLKGWVAGFLVGLFFSIGTPLFILVWINYTSQR